MPTADGGRAFSSTESFARGPHRDYLTTMTPTHDALTRRFLLSAPDGEAFLSYETGREDATITHTFVPSEWRGRGVAGQLVRAFLAWAGDEGRRVESRCSYATAFLARHPELIARGPAGR